MDEPAGPWLPLVSCLRLHPKFCRSVMKTLHHMFYDDGPLPHTHRHYIALMAACRHHCEYLIKLHKAEFLRAGGEPKWLNGIRWAPAKLQALDEIQRVLAHRPWLTDASQVKELCRVGSQKNWSLNELVWGTLILARVHSLCSFIHACGIHSDFDLQATMNGEAEQPVTLPRCNSLSTPRPRKLTPAPKAPAVDDGQAGQSGVIVLLEQLKELNLAKTETNISADDRTRVFNSIHEQNLAIEGTHANGQVECDLSCSAYTGELDYRYENFFNRTNRAAAPTLKIHDFSWDIEGFGVISQLVDSEELVNALDQDFTTARALTYKQMGNHMNVDTTKYRLAIWNYILSLFGIRHDDYDYAEVNKLLDRRMKVFTKTVACFPERTTVHLRESIMEFQFSEKVHVSFLISEARFQAALIYLTRAVMQFMA